MKKRQKFNKNINGFTLAEVLVTLAIIGVVAALTIPNLINKTNDSELKVAYKKKFSELSQVFDQIRADNGGSLAGAVTGNHPIGMDATVLKYFNVIKKGTTRNSSGNTVWHDPDKWYNFNNTLGNTNCDGCAGYILNDGTMMYFASWDLSGCKAFSSTGLCGSMWIDVNGFKNPNKLGKDIFYLYLYENRISPPNAECPILAITSSDVTYCDTSHRGYACAREYLYK